MRILFLEDDGLTRIAPYMRSLGHQPVVLRTGAYDRWHADETVGLGLEVRQANRQASSQELIAAAQELAPDALVSLALLDPHCARDAEVGEYFRRQGLPVVANSPATVLLANDKLRTKQRLREAGIAVTEAVWVTACAEAEVAAERAGYPVVLKRNEGYSGLGMRLCENVDQLRSFYRRDPGPMLLETFLDGLEISVDVLRWDGQCQPLTVISKGKTDRDLRRHPIYRLRLAPHPLPAGLAQRILDIAARSMDLLDIVGVAECELILHPERGPLVLEVNPRLAGTTPLSIAATGIDPRLQFVDMVLGRCDFSALVNTNRIAAQVPIRTPLTEALRTRLAALPEVQFIKVINWVPDLDVSATLTVAAPSPSELLAFLAKLGELADLGSAATDLAGLFTGSAGEDQRHDH